MHVLNCLLDVFVMPQACCGIQHRNRSPRWGWGAGQTRKLHFRYVFVHSRLCTPLRPHVSHLHTLRRVIQEFLKRIPSASALSSQNPDEGKTAMFASASNTSLFGFGSANLEGSGVPRVASLEMLRSIVDQESEKLQSRKSLDTGAQAPRQEQPIASPTSLQQPQVLNTQLFQPSGQAISNAAATLTQSMVPSSPVVRVCLSSTWCSRGNTRLCR